MSEGRRRRGPQFALAVPSWIWHLAFFVYVFSSVRQVTRPDVGAAATLMLLLTLVALALVALVLRRSGDSSSDIAATLAGG